VHLVVALFALTALTGVAAAQQDPCPGLEEDFNALQGLFKWGLVLIAAPNALYGVGQWMTARESQERVEKGRNRIRKTILGVAIATIIVGGLNAISDATGLSSEDCSQYTNNNQNSNAIVEPAVDGLAAVDPSVINMLATVDPEVTMQTVDLAALTVQMAF